MRKTWPVTASFEDGGRGTQAKESKWPLEAGKGKKTVSSRTPRMELIPAHTLILANWDPFWTSDLQICKVKLMVICYSRHTKLVQFPLYRCGKLSLSEVK